MASARTEAGRRIPRWRGRSAAGRLCRRSANGRAGPAAAAGRRPGLRPRRALRRRQRPSEQPSRPSLGLFTRIRAPSEAEADSRTGGDRRADLPLRTRQGWLSLGIPAAGSRAARRARAGRSPSRRQLFVRACRTAGRLIGTIVGYDSAPSEDSVHWLLLRTQSYGRANLRR